MPEKIKQDKAVGKNDKQAKSKAKPDVEEKIVVVKR